MTALIPWLVSQFGQFGGALVLIVLVLLLAAIARYAFWSIVAVLVLWKVLRDHREVMEEENR